MFPFSSSSANDSSSSTSTNSNITSSLSSSNSSKAEQLKQEVTQQLALANAQELINKINEKCYARCITSPSNSISSREQKLISNCMDRYLEAYNIVSRTYVDRITKERTQAALASSSKNLESIDGVGLSNEGFR
ncbi:Tim10/DDP family zinc finger-domain-containing protein [Phakopsora pachyrhizi]|uniref:Mitochondrial import inner membrane translocase subunit n=1 Tax=Phakopsora pachyrhizi TaxID=170000 RepID=A0AAV0AYX3_PHAPC|nr:Tim10/DDP family zinc finger-domain-containing protein [Phakopsora pachyrhizi]